MLEKQRQQVLLEFLNKERFASVPIICGHLNTSASTVRRDIIKLAAQGKIQKIRGGAEMKGVANSYSFDLQEKSLIPRESGNTKTRRLIAKRAVELCANDESIVINGGTSTFMMAEFLRDRQVNIFTNSLILANELMANSSNEISLAGGLIYRDQSLILSSYGTEVTDCFRGSKMFMGCPGISEMGVMEIDPLLVLAEHKLRQLAEKLIVLADSSRIGKKGNLIFSPLSGVDVLITDSNADVATLRFFERQGIEVIVVDAC